MLIQGAQGAGGAADVGLGKLQNFNFPSFNPNQQQSQPTMPQGLGGGIKPYQGPFQIPQAPSGSGDVFGGFTPSGAPMWTGGRDQNTWQTSQLPTAAAQANVARQAPQSMGTTGPNVAGTMGGNMAPSQPQGLGSQPYTGATAQDFWKRTQPQTAPQPAQQQQAPLGRPTGDNGLSRMMQFGLGGGQQNPVQQPQVGLTQQYLDAQRRQQAGGQGGGFGGSNPVDPMLMGIAKPQEQKAPIMIGGRPAPGVRV